MQAPHLPRRKTFLCVQSALAALALSLPVTAGAGLTITITTDGNGVQGNRYNNNGSTDLLQGTGTKGTIVPGIGIDGTPPTGFTASDNDVTIDGWDDHLNSDLASSVAGGGVLSGGSDSVTGNKVTIKGNSSYITGHVVGGVNLGSGKTGDENKGNTVTLNAGTVGGNFIGAIGAGTANQPISYNKAAITGGTVKGHVTGGWAAEYNTNYSPADVSFNEVEISGSTTIIEKDVVGGVSQTGAATSNIVKITGGTLKDSVRGGYVQNAEGGPLGPKEASNNEVHISGNVKVGDNLDADVIIGGDSTGKNQNSGAASDNKVYITANTSETVQIEASVLGGYSYSGDVNNNLVVLGGTGTINIAKDLLGGDRIDSGNNLVGNTLEVNGTGTKIVGGKLDAFQVYKFFLPDNISDGDTLLNVNGQVIINGPNDVINVDLGSNFDLTAGAKIRLINGGNNSIYGVSVITAMSGSGKPYFDYAFSKVVDTPNNDLFAILAYAINNKGQAGSSLFLSEDTQDKVLVTDKGKYVVDDYDPIAQTIPGYAVVPLYKVGTGSTYFPIPSGNIVKVDSWNLSDGNSRSVAGGGAELNTHVVVQNNHVTITNSNISGKVVGGINLGDQATGGEGAGNTVTVNSGTVTSDVIGATGHGADAAGAISHNQVILNGGTFGSNVAGGWAAGDTTKGYSGADVSNNQVTVNNGNITATGNGEVSGGISQTGAATSNAVTITGGTIGGYVRGGFVQNIGNVDNLGSAALSNTVSISGNAIVGSIDGDDYIIGGDATGHQINSYRANTTGAARNNVVTITTADAIKPTINADQILGGWAYKGAAANNSVVIQNNLDTPDDFAVIGKVYGGRSETGSATGNTVYLGRSPSGSQTGEGTITISNNVYGGYVFNDLSGVATNNAVILGGTGAVVIKGNLYGGAVNSGTNHGTGDIAVTGAAIAGNTLEVHGKGHTVGKNLAGFQNLSFYLPENIDNGETLLTVSDTANITGSTVSLFLDGSYNLSKLNNNETINLIHAGTLTGNVANYHATGVAGVSLLYNFNITQNSNDLLATLTGSTQKPTDNPPGGGEGGSGSSPAAPDLVWSGGGEWGSGSGAGWDSGGTYSNGKSVLFGDAGAGTVTIVEAGVVPGKVTVNNSLGHDYTFTGGPISGNNIGLVKENTGTLTLANTNTYTGVTQVNGGTLILTGALPGSALSVGASGRLALRGTAGNGVALATGASLDVHSGARIGGNLEAGTGANLNFYLPGTFAANSTLLNVDGYANITNSLVNVGIDGATSPLQVGDRVILLAAGSTLTGDPSNTTTTGSALLGVSLRYAFDLDTVDGKYLRATVSAADSGGGSGGEGGGSGGEGGGSGGGGEGGGSGGGGVTLNPQTKALSEGFLAGTAFLGQGTDFLTGQGLPAAVKAGAGASGANGKGGKGGQGFALVGGGSLRHESGSRIEVDGYTLVAGASAALGSVTLGGFFEHGQGDYSTYNSFANAASIRGSGDATYNGGGVLAHVKFAETARGLFYGEASARAGRIELDYKTRNLADGLGRLAAYESESTYVGAHAGLGYVLKLNPQSALRFYGQYLWSQQGADSVRLTTGEPVKFDDVNSHRTRIGATWQRDLSASAKLYAGLAWEHEFDGESKATIHGYRVDAPDVQGNTGVLDVGLSFSPTPGSPLSLEIGAQGYAGKRKGGTGNVRVNYSF